jgi:hypothetical protein
MVYTDLHFDPSVIEPITNPDPSSLIHIIVDPPHHSAIIPVQPIINLCAVTRTAFPLPCLQPSPHTSFSLSHCLHSVHKVVIFIVIVIATPVIISYHPPLFPIIVVVPIVPPIILFPLY